jgi:hypothetical protein
MLGSLIFWEAVRIGRLQYHWPLRAATAALAFGVLGLAYLSLSPALAEMSTSRVRSLVGFRFFQWFSLVLLILANAGAFAFTLVAFTEERDRRTLETLQCVGVRAWQVVAGKLILVQFRLVEAVLAAAPVGALAVLLGGVSAERLLYTLIVNLAVAFLTSAFVALFAATLPMLFALVVAGAGLLAWFLCSVVMQYMGAWTILQSPWMRIHPLRAAFVQFDDRMEILVPIGFSLATGLAFAFLTALSLYRFGRPPSSADRKPRATEPVGDDPLAWERRRANRLALRRALPWLTAALGLAILWTATRPEFHTPTSYLYLPASDEPESVRLLAMLSAMWCGFALLPASVMFAASVASHERRRGSDDLLYLAGLTRRQLLASQFRRLRRLGALALSPIAFAGVCCVFLHWTTWAGVLLATGLAATAVGVSSTLGMWIGWTGRRPLTTAAYLAVFFVLWSGIAHIVYDNAPRTHETYRWLTALSPGHHLGVLMALDSQQHPRYTVQLADGPIAPAEARVWAITTNMAYACIALTLHAVSNWRLTAADGQKKPLRSNTVGGAMQRR